MSKNRNIIEGRILSFDKSPFSKDFDLSSLKIDKKRIFIIDGIIESIEPVNFINPEFQDIEIVDYGDHLISAGFVDAHVHYPQTAIIASWGKRLIDWLNIYTFPEEMRFSNLNYASEIAARYIDFSLSRRNTTTDLLPKDSRIDLVVNFGNIGSKYYNNKMSKCVIK